MRLTHTGLPNAQQCASHTEGWAIISDGSPRNGVTVEEIKAALLHATAYCGIPAGLDALRAAHEVQLGATPARTPGTAASAGSNCFSDVHIAALGPLTLAFSMLSAADQ